MSVFKNNSTKTSFVLQLKPQESLEKQRVVIKHPKVRQAFCSQKLYFQDKKNVYIVIIEPCGLTRHQNSIYLNESLIFRIMVIVSMASVDLANF